MMAPIRQRPRREILSPEGERWLRGQPGHGAFPYFGQDLPEVWAAHAERIVAERMSPIRQRQLVQADTSGPVITVFFVSGLCVYLFPGIGGRPTGRGARLLRF